MSGLFAMRREPTGQAMTENDFWQAATSQPFSMAQTAGQSTVEGFLANPVLGTYTKELQLPDAVPQAVPDGDLGAAMQNPPGYRPTTPDQQQRAAAVQQNQQELQKQYDAQYGALTDEQQKASADFRPNIGIQPGMTAARQSALAEWNDAKEYRARVLDRSNHGLIRFGGNVLGSLTDPVNYIPVIGPEVRAAAVARWGVMGAAGITAADAALNAGLASAATAPVRSSLGDDVSWQAIVSQMSMAALGGAVVGGALHGAGHALDAWNGSRAVNALENVMKSRAILNEAIDGVVKGEDISLSPAAVSEIGRIGDQAAPSLRAQELAASAPDQTASIADILTTDDFVAGQRGITVEELHARASAFQPQLADAAQRIADETGVEFKNPGVKKLETAAEKVSRKGYSDASSLTDLARGAFVVDSPAQAEQIASQLAKQFKVLDEGWKRNDFGYFDRKVLVRAPDGTVAEIQIAPRPIFDAKKGGLGQAYDKSRSMPRGAERDALTQQQKEGYAAAVRDTLWAGIADRSSGPNLPSNLLRQSASDISPPELATSSSSTSTHGPLGLRTANADLLSSDRTAGRQSQSQNFMGDTSKPNVGAFGENSNVKRILDPSQPAAPAPDPAVKQAAARIAKPDDLKAVAVEHGVNPETGEFREQYDIQQLEAEGRLHPEDKALLAEADVTFENGKAYGEAMKAAFTCVVGAAA